MNNKQVLVYEVLESTTDLRSIYVGHMYLKKLMQFQKIYWNISLLHDQAQKQEIKFLLVIFTDKNHLKKGKYGTI